MTLRPALGRRQFLVRSTARRGSAGQYANTISPLIDWVNARYWRVEVDDQANPAGYIEMGLHVPRPWIPARGEYELRRGAGS